MKIGLGIGVTQPQNTPFASLGNPSSLFVNGEQGAWYDPSDFQPNWRRNLLTYSDQFDNAAWTKTGITVTPNTDVAPDGTTTADTVVFSGTNLALSNSTASITAGQIVVGSVYVKGTAGETILVAIGGVDQSFTLDGTWQRLSASKTAINNSFNINTFGGATARTIKVWGAQLEVGSIASAYQKITDGVSDYLTYQPLPILYQDSAGTTPVTAVEQPVGLMLDKSKGLVLGPELIIDGNFDDPSKWVYAGGASVSGGRLNYTGAEFYNYVTPLNSNILTLGKWYEVRWSIVSYSAGYFYVTQAGGNPITPSSSVGEYSAKWQATSTQLVLSGISNFVGSIDNISVRELPGNHAFQSTSANRPVLSARRNLLVGTEVLSTQTVTSRATPYVLSFWGTGSITLSGTATGTLTGTGASNRVYLEFTPTAGTLTLTVSGSVTRAQLEVANEGL